MDNQTNRLNAQIGVAKLRNETITGRLDKVLQAMKLGLEQKKLEAPKEAPDA